MSEQLSKLINLINSNNFQQAEKEVKQEIALDPDIGGLNIGSIIIHPKSAFLFIGGRIKLKCL